MNDSECSKGFRRRGSKACGSLEAAEVRKPISFLESLCQGTKNFPGTQRKAISRLKLSPTREYEIWNMELHKERKGLPSTSTELHSILPNLASSQIKQSQILGSNSQCQCLRTRCHLAGIPQSSHTAPVLRW